MLPRELRQYSSRKLFIVLGGMVIITLITTTATIFTNSTLMKYRQTAQRHNDTRIQLETLSVNLSEAETSQRGFLLTNDPADLAAYQSAINQILPDLSKLNALTQQQASNAKLAQLYPLVNQKVDELNRTITLAQNGDSTGAQAMVQSGKGKLLMDQIRQIDTQAQNDESVQLSNDRNTINNLATLARNISLVSLLATLGLTGLVYFIYVKAIHSERRLDRAKDEFVSLASHQLRTPATGIKSILSTLVAGDFGPLNDKQAYFMKRALESNERELGIIEELLNVAKADAGRLILHATNFDLDTLVSSVAEEQSAAIAKKGQNLALHHSKKPLQIYADEEKLYMAIGNLLDNARKYTPEDGQLSIVVSQHYGNAHIEVVDSGIGIEPDEIEHIFDRFHRAHDALEGNVEGAGLGLYLASRIAELHEGTIEVSSKRGIGTKFVMILPQGDAHAAQSAIS